jgi:hypothetical protein
MKTFNKLVLIFFLAVAGIRSWAQGFIVPNGIETNTFPGEINVWNSGSQGTTFFFTPVGRQLPSIYTNIFNFNEPATIGVRVFMVQSNEAISLQPILSQSWVELALLNNYVFTNGVPFYVALYTGSNFAPPYPPFPPYQYLDPVYGWARLVNNQGQIQLLDGALAYQAAGIYAGTQNIIQVPEPSFFALIGINGLLLASRCRKA